MKIVLISPAGNVRREVSTEAKAQYFESLGYTRIKESEKKTKKTAKSDESEE